MRDRSRERVLPADELLAHRRGEDGEQRCCAGEQCVARCGILGDQRGECVEGDVGVDVGN